MSSAIPNLLGEEAAEWKDIQKAAINYALARLYARYVEFGDFKESVLVFLRSMRRWFCFMIFGLGELCIVVT